MGGLPVEVDLVCDGPVIATRALILHKDSDVMRRGDRMRRVSGVLAILFVVVTVAAGVACRRGVPVLDAKQKPPTVDGTISGRVMTEGDSSRLVSRRVDIINIETGDRRAVTTSSNGGFTVKVPPGKYRPQVELRPGETIAKAPATIDVNASDMESDVEIVITTAPASPHPADTVRDPDGLGAPIA